MMDRNLQFTKVVRGGAPFPTYIIHPKEENPLKVGPALYGILNNQGYPTFITHSRTPVAWASTKNDDTYPFNDTWNRLILGIEELISNNSICMLDIVDSCEPENFSEWMPGTDDFISLPYNMEIK